MNVRDHPADLCEFESGDRVADAAHGTKLAWTGFSGKGHLRQYQGCLRLFACVQSEGKHSRTGCISTRSLVDIIFRNGSWQAIAPDDGDEGHEQGQMSLATPSTSCAGAITKE